MQDTKREFYKEKNTYVQECIQEYYIQIKNVCSSKTIPKKIQATEWGK